MHGKADVFLVNIKASNWISSSLRIRSQNISTLLELIDASSRGKGMHKNHVISILSWSSIAGARAIGHIKSDLIRSHP